MANSPKVSSRAKASLSISLEHNPAQATEMEKTSLADFFPFVSFANSTDKLTINECLLHCGTRTLYTSQTVKLKTYVLTFLQRRHTDG